MARSFSFPSSEEIAAWLRACGQPCELSRARKIGRSVRISSYIFTASALLPAASGIALSFLVGQVRSRDFWIIYLATVLIVIAAVLGSRDLVANFWPRQAVIYYACAVLDRLSEAERGGRPDRKYLSIILPALESALLNQKLFRNLAGTSEARAYIRRAQVRLTKAIGIAELDSIRSGEHGGPGVAELRKAIGSALVVVYTDAIVDTEDLGVPTVDRETSEKTRMGWFVALTNKTQEKAAELVLVAAGSALLPFILKINH
jgi:hypothetical protein